MARSGTAQLFWPYIRHSIEGIISALSDLDEAGVPLDWRPPAAGTNSVYALATHALGATEHRLLDVLCGIEVDRDREAEFAAAVRSVRVIDGRVARPLGPHRPGAREAHGGRPRRIEATSAPG